MDCLVVDDEIGSEKNDKSFTKANQGILKDASLPCRIDMFVGMLSTKERGNEFVLIGRRRAWRIFSELSSLLGVFSSVFR